jgi:DNA-binding MarR family transcriptional regulator
MTDRPSAPLNRRELKSWRRFIAGTGALLGALDRQLRDDSGLSLDYFGVLSHLSQSPGTSMRMTELAEALSFSASRLSHAVASMERNGWVERTSSPDDGRVRVASLTESGARILQEAWPGHAGAIRRLLLDHLDDAELSVLSDAFTRIDQAARRGATTQGTDAVAPETSGNT